MLNKDIFVHDPSTYRLADGGVAKVLFPPDDEQKPILREQLQTFVCEGAYADGLCRILDAFNAAAGRRGDVPAVWISGFYGSGKSMLAAMLGALWANLEFDDGATAEGLVQAMPSEVRASLRELRASAARLGGVLVGGTTLGRGSQHPASAILEVVFQATGLPRGIGGHVALWLDDQGILSDVRGILGGDFRRAAEGALLDPALAQAVLKTKPDLAPDADTLMDRFGLQFEPLIRTDPTVDVLTETTRRTLSLGRDHIPLTLLILDEVQQFVREDSNISLTIQTIAEDLCSKFQGRVFLVGTGQSALGDVPYLDKLLTRFVLHVQLGSTDINSVIRKTVLLKSETAKPEIDKMLDACAGEIDKHLQGSSLKHSAADRPNDAADWPILASRRRFWERVLLELDRSGLQTTLRGQLRITLDAVKRYGDRPLGVSVPSDFLFDTFGAEALSRNLILSEIADRITTLRTQSGDGPLQARLLILIYLIGRIAGDAANHGVYAKPDILADLLIEDLGEAASIRATVPELLERLHKDAAIIRVNDEWRLQTRESAEWQASFNRAEAAAASDVGLVPRNRAALLDLAIQDALAAVGTVQHGVSKTARRIERVLGDAKPAGDGLLLRLWNGWDHALTSVSNDIKAADPSKDATIHLVIEQHREADLRKAIIAREAATVTLQIQGIPTTDAGKEAKAAMESTRAREEETAKAILKAAVEQARVFIAGGAEVGHGLSRADAVREAAGRVLDRLYPQFGIGDHLGWDRVVTQAQKRVPDAMKEVGYTGDPQDHPVCKAVLRALRPSKKGSELRSYFAAPPCGWGRPVVDGALLALANAGQVKVTAPDGKRAIAADLTATQLGTHGFAPETRVVSAAERIAVRGLANALNHQVPSGQENDHLLTIVRRLEEVSHGAGGNPPAPAAPDIPGIAAFKASSGNDLLAELAARAEELKPLIGQWQAAKAEKECRLREWELAVRLVALGAGGRQSELDAIRAARSLLADPNPVAPLVAAAAEDLRSQANAAYQQWYSAFEAGEARLKDDTAWNQLSPDKKHDIRVAHSLLSHDPPDLSTPGKIADSLGARGLSQWRDMAFALPARIDLALRDAAIEIEPKTQHVALPLRVIRSAADLEAWLGEIRAAIASRLGDGPVLPSA